MFHTYALGILLCVAGAYSLYDSASDVVTLTPDNFDKLVLNSDEIWIVEFFAPWCGHCKNLVPEYQKAATALKGIAKVGAVDANTHKSLGQTYGVSGFPTIKVFNGKKHVPYQGQRTAEKFVDAALQMAKEKAYGALGKKSSGSSDQLIKKPYGHAIPWKKINRINNSSGKTIHKATKGLQKNSKTIRKTAKAAQKTAKPPQKAAKPAQKAAKPPHKTAKPAQNTAKPALKTVKPVNKFSKKNTTSTDIQKFNELQLKLFRRKLFDAGHPKVVKAVYDAFNATVTKNAIAKEKANEIKNILRRTKKSTRWYWGRYN